jgi:hypothetical protein
MTRRIVIALLLLGITVSGCVTDVTTETVPEYPVTGTVTSGPTCPVVQDPPDPACDDRPVPSASLQILDEGGELFGEATADPNGEFSLNLPAGRYTLVPQPVEGLMGTAPPQDFESGPGVNVDLIVQYDTGIR